MPGLRLVSLVLLACLSPQLTLADEVFLRNGVAVKGTVANRQAVIDKLEQQEAIGILIENADEDSVLQRYLIGEIDYLIIEDGDEKKVIDVISWQQMDSFGERPLLAPAAEPDTSYGTAGPMLLGVGIIVASLGALIPMGEDAGDYDTANYVLMVSGVSMFALGVGLSATHRCRNISAHSEDGGAVYLALSYRF